jgi:hypothetical protein
MLSLIHRILSILLDITGSPGSDLDLTMIFGGGDRAKFAWQELVLSSFYVRTSVFHILF